MSVAKMGELWWERPGWLRDSDNSSSDIKTQATAETKKGGKNHQRYGEQRNPKE